MSESCQTSNKIEITPNEHAGWKLRGIQKYLPPIMDHISLQLFDKFVDRAKNVWSEDDIYCFERDLIEQFSANPALEAALTQRLTVENALSLEFEDGLQKLEKLIQRYEKILEGK